jgi:hypothetical protein
VEGTQPSRVSENTERSESDRQTWLDKDGHWSQLHMLYPCHSQVQRVQEEKGLAKLKFELENLEFSEGLST